MSDGREKIGSIEAARAMWTHRGQRRPAFAVEPGPGQESVWDYPRPPAIVPDARRVVVRSGDVLVADSRRALRVLETASAPTFYLPWADVDRERLESAPGSSFCEWKGRARYWSVLGSERRHERVAWDYPEPLAGSEALREHLAFYPAELVCTVDGERALPQPGGFYGGWITRELVGPFKGEPGTGGW